MQIQLKQTEIVAAVKGYITSQGINLQNKSVDIAFTAGRKESGLTADVVITEAEGIVSAIPVVSLEKPVAEPEAEVEVEVEVKEPTEAVVAPATTSLFST